MSRLNSEQLAAIFNDTLGFSIPVKCSISEKAWRGVVALKTDDKGKLSLDRVSKDEADDVRDDKGVLAEGYYDAENADELLITMLKFVSDDVKLHINRWDMIVPEVTSKLDHEAKVLSTIAIKEAFKSYITADGKDEIEVMLSTAFRRHGAAPNLVVRKMGSHATGKGANKSRLGGLTIPTA